MFEQIRTIIAKHFNKSEEIITMETNLADELSADSLDVVELILAIEKEFSVEVDPDKAVDIKTVGDIVDYVGTLVK